MKGRLGVNGRDGNAAVSGGKAEDGLQCRKAVESGAVAGKHCEVALNVVGALFYRRSEAVNRSA